MLKNFSNGPLGLMPIHNYTAWSYKQFIRWLSIALAGRQAAGLRASDSYYARPWLNKLPRSVFSFIWPRLRFSADEPNAPTLARTTKGRRQSDRVRPVARAACHSQARRQARRRRDARQDRQRSRPQLKLSEDSVFMLVLVLPDCADHQYLNFTTQCIANGHQKI